MTYDVEDALELLRQAAGGDAEGAGVREVRDEGVDRVREAAPLTHLLEQSRGRSRAESDVENREGIAALVGARHPVDSEQQVHLLERSPHGHRTVCGPAHPRSLPWRHRVR